MRNQSNHQQVKGHFEMGLVTSGQLCGISISNHLLTFLITESPSTASVLRHRTRFAHNTLRFPVSLWALGSCSRLFTSSLSYMLIWHAMSTATYPFQTSLALPASGWHLLFITSVTWLSASSSWLQTPASRPVFSNTSTLDLPLSKLHTGLDTTYTG